MENIDAKVMELLELRRMADELTGEIAAVQGEIMTHMNLAGVDELTTDHYRVSWKVVKSARVDTAALRKAMPEIVQAFTRTQETRRFTVSA